MNRPHLQQSLLFVTLFIVFQTSATAQNLRAFNQNASRSNHTGLSLAFTPVYSTAVNNSKDSLLFRGNGAGFRFGADYFFGKASIGFSSGFSSSAPDDATINNFLKRSAVPPDQLQITKSRQQNMYLLLGPSVRFGKMVELYAHAKGGLFINNSGLVSIQQKGAQRAAYRNESTGKSIYPGFFTGLGVQYNTKSDVWSFGIGADYMNTKSEVNNYDSRRGGGIEGLKLSRNITDIVTGFTIRYNIKSSRDAQSGQSTGRRVLPTVNKREITARDAGSGQSTGRRVLPTVNKREINTSRDAGSGMSTGRRLGKPKYEDMRFSDETMDEGPGQDPSCGPVTVKTTNPDGSVTENTFSCPEDAADYASKVDGKKQKQWVPNNFRRTSSDGASTGIVSGRLTWPAVGNTGIVTNTTISNSSPRSGSTTLNSQSSSTRQTPQSSFGTMVRLSAREAGSGMATGKRSRDAGSGMATGRRQYQPIFIENSGNVCNPCIADAQMAAVNNNPLYEQSGSVGSNPLYKGNERAAGTTDDDCDGIGGIDVYLLDIENGSVVAKTVTEACGDFFFANVPEGDYVVRISGSFTGKKGYDVYLKSKTDLLGSVEQNNQPAQLFINTGGGGGDDNNNGMVQKAGISTSRSNIRRSSIAIVEADLDGDGEYESIRATATFSDGSSRDITSSARTVATKGITLNGDGLQMSRRRVEVLKSNRSLSSIAMAADGRAVAAFSDGTTQDVTDALVINTAHANLKQYTITIADENGDGAADAIVKTKTKSNQSNDRVFAGNMEEEEIWSPRSNIKMLNTASGDVDGDGLADMLVGGDVMNPKAQGDPVHGVDVKLGLAGKMIKAGPSNEDGEFEFTSLETGNYTLTVAQTIFIDDETVVTVTGESAENSNNELMRKGWDGVVKGGSIVRSGNAGTITMDAGEPINFRWTPLVPKPKEPVTYKLRVWQLMQGQNGTQAMRSNQPIVEKTIIDATETSVQGILTGPCKPPYLCDFVWSVQAISNGKLVSAGYDNQTSTFSIDQPGDEQDAVTKAQDHNSSRSNKTASISSGDDDIILNEDVAKNALTFRWTPIVPKPQSPVTYKLRVWQLMQGQNGTQAMRSNQPIAEKTVTNATETSVQGILTGPCKPPYLCDFIWSVQAISNGKLISNTYDNQAWSFSVKQPGDTENPVMKIQNNNTVRSNRTDNALLINDDNNNDPNGIAIDESGTSKPKKKPGKITTGPVKWTAPESMRTAINTSYTNLETMLSSLNAMEEQLNNDQSNAKSLVNTSRSNIKSQRAAISNLEQTLDELQTKDKDAAMNELQQKRNETDLQFLKLHESIKQLGPQYNSISNVLKSSHDMVMGAIRNLK